MSSVEIRAWGEWYNWRAERERAKQQQSRAR